MESQSSAVVVKRIEQIIEKRASFDHVGHSAGIHIAVVCDVEESALGLILVEQVQHLRMRVLTYRRCPSKNRRRKNSGSAGHLCRHAHGGIVTAYRTVVNGEAAVPDKVPHRLVGGGVGGVVVRHPSTLSPSK